MERFNINDTKKFILKFEFNKFEFNINKKKRRKRRKSKAILFRQKTHTQVP